MEEHTVYLMLGSNLGDRRAYLSAAERFIQERMGAIIRRSRIYETQPWGVSDEQPPYLNRALVVNSSHAPRALLNIAHAIERELGRSPETKGLGEARKLDIDILFYDDLVMSESDLQIPHPRLHERRFVLQPLLDIVPQLKHPVFGKTVEELLQMCTDKRGVKPYEDVPKGRKGRVLPYRFIAVEGNIGVGKTTFCRLLERELGARLILEQFADNPFLAYFYEEPERYAFPVELFFMTERHKQLQEELAQRQLFDQLIVSDYLFAKTALFARNNLSEEEFRLFQRLFDVLNASFPHPDLVVYLHRPIEELLEQIGRRGRTYEENIQKTYLCSIQNVYMQYLRHIEDFPVLILDVSGKDFERDQEAFRQMIALLEKDWKPGVHHWHLGDREGKP